MDLILGSFWIYKTFIWFKNQKDKKKYAPRWLTPSSHPVSTHLSNWSFCVFLFFANILYAVYWGCFLMESWFWSVKYHKSVVHISQKAEQYLTSTKTSGHMLFDKFLLINWPQSDIHMIIFRFVSLDFRFVFFFKENPYISCYFDLHDLITISILANTFPL